MSTIVNTPASSGDSSGASALIVGAIILLLAIVLFAYFGRGLFNQGSGSSNPGISVPEQVDINVNQPGQAQ